MVVSALGFLLIGFGVLTIWSGFQRLSVFAVLRSILGAPPGPERDQYGKVKG